VARVLVSCWPPLAREVKTDLVCNECGDKFGAGTLGELKAPGAASAGQEDEQGEDGEEDVKIEVADGEIVAAERLDTLGKGRKASQEDDPSMVDAENLSMDISTAAVAEGSVQAPVETEGRPSAEVKEVPAAKEKVVEAVVPSLPST